MRDTKQRSIKSRSGAWTWASAAGPGGFRTAARACACVIALAAMAMAMGCEDTSHDNIDKWMRTQKGPGKLVDAFGDSGLSADLSAHAGQNLIRMDKIEDVMELLRGMKPERRAEVLAALVPRLWEDARMEGELSVPSPAQIMAKDALFDMRGFADGDTRSTIDRYLADWLTEGYYSARARVGRVRGATIVRVLGPNAAPGLLRRAKSLLTHKTDGDNARFQLEDPLLLGLAATGDAEAAGLLLDLATAENPDKTLQKRAQDALYMGYIKNDGLFELADAGALVPHLDRLVALAQDGSSDNRTINDAIRLIGATGPTHCIKPLVGLMSATGSGDAPDQLLWVTANAALQCAKSNALVPVADALPVRGTYSETELFGAIIDPISALDDKQAIARQARTLLESQSWVARIIGVELLGRLELAESAAEDAASIRRLGGDKTRLRGWWGDQSAVKKRERKKEPRLGERANDVADKLDRVAKSG